MTTAAVAPGSQSSLREANAARVVEAIHTYGKITQVELVAATGLSAATVSNIVKLLAAQGIVKTDTTIRSGRRAQLVSLATSTGFAVGIEIGRRQLAVEIADEAHQITESKRFPLPNDHRVDTTLDRAALLVMELVETIGSTIDEVVGVAVALPAPIDPTTGLIARAGTMPGWEDTPIAQVLSQRLGREVTVENDANAGVVGEARFGALRGIDDAFYIHVSHSVGAGILLGGKVHRGSRGLAGEIGHVQVAPTGLICRCGGRGCLKTIVGAEALLDLMRLNPQIHTMSDLLRAAHEGDPGCRQVLADAANAIGGVLADMATTYAPEKIVLGGELALTGDFFLTPIREALARRPYLGGDIEVVTTPLEGRSEVLGALAIARDAFIASAFPHSPDTVSSGGAQ
ncbi:ROK family transcriptional regulator [Schaalia suimastitidis]|uniref:ROK family transcriptional regulator n=1 Tax=Schaalia suimastitidis TaxID=121163 RepID=UPI0003F7C8EC|nr:ROK family transcriptional regulator [Schaalia suimastitidis]